MLAPAATRETSTACPTATARVPELRPPAVRRCAPASRRSPTRRRSGRSRRGRSAATCTPRSSRRGGGSSASDASASASSSASWSSSTAPMAHAPRARARHGAHLGVPGGVHRRAGGAAVVARAGAMDRPRGLQRRHAGPGRVQRRGRRRRGSGRDRGGRRAHLAHRRHFARPRGATRPRHRVHRRLRCGRPVLRRRGLPDLPRPRRPRRRRGVRGRGEPADALLARLVRAQSPRKGGGGPSPRRCSASRRPSMRASTGRACWTR